MSSGLLAAKYESQIATVADAVLGMTGPESVLDSFLRNIALQLENENKLKFASASEFTFKEFPNLLNHGEVKSFIDVASRLHYRASIESVLNTSWHFASCGTAVGFCKPDVIRRMFEGTFARRSEDSWREAVNAGLAIPNVQEVIEYDDFEYDTNKMFLHYLSECRPDLLGSLGL